VTGTGRRRRWLLAPVATLALTVLLPVAGLLVAVWTGGWRLEIVRTGSMEPTYPVGSMTVVEPVDASEVRPGMALSFVDPGSPGQVVTHRVVRVIGQDTGLFFETQGDANATPDPELVPARNVRGKVGWHVPHLGSAAWALRGARAPLALVVAPGVLLALGEWRAWRRRQAWRHIEDLEASLGRADDELARLTRGRDRSATADDDDPVAEARVACRTAVDALATVRELASTGAGPARHEPARR
jgi:signal peptidase